MTELGEIIAPGRIRKYRYTNIGNKQESCYRILTKLMTELGEIEIVKNIESSYRILTKFTKSNTTKHVVSAM